MFKTSVRVRAEIRFEGGIPQLENWPQFRKLRNDDFSTPLFLTRITLNFGSDPNRDFSVSSVSQVPSRAAFTGEIAIFLLPPRHNKQRDPPKRSDFCYLVPHLSFKQKTSPLDSAFSRRIASKLQKSAIFNGFRGAGFPSST